jgi:hypothetical protein
MDVQPRSAAPQVSGAIRQAARSTGTNFSYLLATAQIESNLNPSAQSPTSSAQGLFQFIDQTWLGTMKRAGPALGFGNYSAAIWQAPDGHFEVPNPAARDAIMKLRTDSKVNAMMAGAYTRNNAAQLNYNLGRPPSEGELYIAHFLGSEGAAKLIGAAISAPNTRALDMFPQAAGANRAIFFDSSGRPRGALDVYRVLTGRYEMARAGTGGPEVTGPLRGSLPGNTQGPVQTAVAVPDTAGLTSAFAEARGDGNRVVDNRPLFQSMFTSPPSNKGVAPLVSALWNPVQAGQARSSAPALDLFTDTKPDTPKLAGGGA